MVKTSRSTHVRTKGRGRGKTRKNPKRGSFGKKASFPKVTHTVFVQDLTTRDGTPADGRFKGRRTVLGVGDRTGIIREGKAGRILGRTKSQKKRA